MKIMREVGVDQEKDHIQKILEGMTEVAVVDLNQVHKLVQMEAASDTINVENTITLQKNVQHPSQNRNRTSTTNV